MFFEDTLIPNQPVRLGSSVQVFEHAGRYYLFDPRVRGYVGMNNAMYDSLLRIVQSGMPLNTHLRNHDDSDLAKCVKALLDAKLLVPNIPNPPSPAICSPHTDYLPHKLTVFPTTRCNMRCIYCYAEGGDLPRSVSLQQCRVATDYYLERLKKAHSDSNQAPAPSLSLHGGGEPTSDFFLLRQIVDLFKLRSEESGFSSSVSMVSNGLFGPTVLDWILKECISVSISLDGPPNIQNKNRPQMDGSGSYESVVANIERLIKAGRHLSVRATITGDDIQTMRQTVELARELGIVSVHFEPVTLCGRCRETRPLSCDPHEFSEQLLQCFLLGLEYDIDIGYSGLRCFDQHLDRFCSACGENLCLTVDGYVTTCYEVLDPHDPAAGIFFVGRVEDDRLQLDEAKLLALKSRTAASMNRCSSCFMRSNCAGDCLAKTFRYSGNLFEPDPERCVITQCINREIITWIADGKIEARRPDKCLIASVNC